MCDKLPKGKERKSIFKKLVKLKTEKQMDYFELECAVEQWAEEKEIFDKATPMAQALKTLEETTELCTAYNVINKRTGKMIDGQFVKDE